MSCKKINLKESQPMYLIRLVKVKSMSVIPFQQLYYNLLSNPNIHLLFADKCRQIAAQFSSCDWHTSVIVNDKLRMSILA